jgi:predicted secreted protein
MDKRIWIGVGAVIVVIAAVVIAVNVLGGSTLVVEQSQDGATVQASVGDTIELKLAGNPTTGFNWSTTDIDAAVLEQDGDPSFDADDDSLGSPGVVTMTYTVVGSGSSPLQVSYGPVSGGEATETFAVTVVAG